MLKGSSLLTERERDRQKAGLLFDFTVDRESDDRHGNFLFPVNHNASNRQRWRELALLGPWRFHYILVSLTPLLHIFSPRRSGNYVIDG